MARLRGPNRFLTAKLSVAMEPGTTTAANTQMNASETSVSPFPALVTFDGLRSDDTSRPREAQTGSSELSWMHWEH